MPRGPSWPSAIHCAAAAGTSKSAPPPSPAMPAVSRLMPAPRAWTSSCATAGAAPRGRRRRRARGGAVSPPPYRKVTESSRLDDGWFDLVTLRAEGAFESAAAYLELLRRGSRNGSGRVWFSRGKTVRVEVVGGEPLRVQLDGEVVGTTPFDVRMLPGALRVLVDPAKVPGGVPARG